MVSGPLPNPEHSRTDRRHRRAVHWVKADWPIGVWAAMLGSVLILPRNKLAVPVFAVSRGAFLVSLIYTYVLTDGGKIMGGQMMITSAVITALVLFFLWYSRRMTRRGVLRQEPAGGDRRPAPRLGVRERPARAI